jgi:hypothetical protein
MLKFISVSRYFTTAERLPVGSHCMTEQQRELLLKALQEQAAKHAASPDAAMEFLVATGTYTKAGELAPEFGGPGYVEELE